MIDRILVVARYEFLTNIKKTSFLWAALGIPLLTVVIMAVVFLVIANTSGQGSLEVETIGFVDRAEVLTADVERPEHFVPFESVDQARAALDEGEIDTYFVLPPIYMQTGSVRLYAYGTVPEEARSEIEGFVLENLVAGVESDLPRERIIDPTNTTIFMESSQRELSESGFFGLFLTPLIFVFVFMMALQVTSAFVMSGVVEEKENRVMEILITTVTPFQLLGGKLLGLGSLGLLQLLIWLVAGAAALFLGRNTEALAGITLLLDLIVMALLYFLLTYFLFSSILAGIGAVVGREQESRQYAGIFSMLVVIPFFFIIQFLDDPNGTIPVILSLFPFTASVAMIMRSAFTVVPLEQVLLSFGLLALTAIIVTWASAKIFRWATLLYGQRIGLREVWRVIRGPVEIGVVETTGSSTTSAAGGR